MSPASPDRTVDLKWLAGELGTRAADLLQARAGSRAIWESGRDPFSPFAILNDVTGVVRVALDAELLDGEPLNFHPPRQFDDHDRVQGPG